jgi:hypothetical protein
VSDVRRCPTHPWLPVNDCPRCDARIARAELARDDPGDGTETQREEVRFERFLDRVGGGE